MASRRSFRVEKKTFQIERRGDRVSIEEFNNGGRTAQLYPIDAARWLKDVMADVISEEPRIGFLESRRFGWLEIVLKVKSNRGGTFLSVLHISKGYRRGYAVIYCPRGRNCEGWDRFYECLLGVTSKRMKDKVVMEKAPEKETVEEILAQDPRPLRVEIKEGFTEGIQSLRKYALLLEAESDGIDWDTVYDSLQEIFSLRKKPAVKMLSTNTCMMVCDTEREKERIGKVKSFKVQGASIKILIWSPGLHTIPTGWARETNRTIGLHGLPLHLWSVQVVTKLISIFGHYEMTVAPPEELGKQLIVWIKASHCDLRKVPQIIDLSDVGCTYPIRVIVPWEESIAEVQSSPCQQQREEDEVPRRQTYADVAARPLPDAQVEIGNRTMESECPPISNSNKNHFNEGRLRSVIVANPTVALPTDKGILRGESSMENQLQSQAEEKEKEAAEGEKAKEGEIQLQEEGKMEENQAEDQGEELRDVDGADSGCEFLNCIV